MADSVNQQGPLPRPNSRNLASKFSTEVADNSVDNRCELRHVPLAFGRGLELHNKVAGGSTPKIRCLDAIPPFRPHGVPRRLRSIVRAPSTADLASALETRTFTAWLTLLGHCLHDFVALDKLLD